MNGCRIAEKNEFRYIHLLELSKLGSGVFYNNNFIIINIWGTFQVVLRRLGGILPQFWANQCEHGPLGNLQGWYLVLKSELGSEAS